MEHHDYRSRTFVWKTRKFEGEFKWNGSSRWKSSGKKVIPFEVLPFSRFYRNDRNFLYHFFGFLVPGFLSRGSETYTQRSFCETSLCHFSKKRIFNPWQIMCKISITETVLVTSFKMVTNLLKFQIFAISLICVGNSMTCSDIRHKYHEWYFKIVD